MSKLDKTTFRRVVRAARIAAEEKAAAEKTIPINRVVLASKPIYEALKHAGLIPSQNAGDVATGERSTSSTRQTG
jgi:hypothetical protein